jgi:cysteine synthase
MTEPTLELTPSIELALTRLARVGDTPLVRLRRIVADLPDPVEVWAKGEWLNPSGSVRTARRAGS